MTAEMHNDQGIIQTSPRTRVRVAQRLEGLDHVRRASADESEPFGRIVMQIAGVGVPPAVECELASAGLSITSCDTNADMITEVEARRVLWFSAGDVDVGDDDGGEA